MDKGERIRRMIDNGSTATEIAEALGCSRGLVYFHALEPVARNRLRTAEYHRARARGLDTGSATARANTLVARACASAYYARLAEAMARASAPPAPPPAPPPATAERA